MGRLLFATDLHGCWESYRELCELARAPECVALVLGGDLFPRPDLRAARPARPQERFVRERLGPALAALRRERPELFLGGILGNDDLPGAQAALDELPGWSGLHLRRVALAPGLWIAGYSGVPITPFRLSDWDRPDRAGWEPAKLAPAPLRSDPAGALVPLAPAELLGGPSIADELEELAARGDPGRTIYVVHTPPAGCGLGQMHGGRDIGSEALRAWLERHQPPLSLHGHVHEGPRQAGTTHVRAGRTWVCNPGDSRRRLRALWIDLERLDAPPRPA